MHSTLALVRFEGWLDKTMSKPGVSSHSEVTCETWALSHLQTKCQQEAEQ